MLSKPKALTNEELEQLRAIVARTNLVSLIQGIVRINSEELVLYQKAPKAYPNLMRLTIEEARVLTLAMGEL